MKKEIKKMWIKALRSGDYEQCQGRLRRNGEYCCLGVLCELYSKETGYSWGDGLLGDVIHEATGKLPSKVMTWSGLTSRDPKIGARHATDRNDYNGQSFNTIANAISRYL